MERAAIEKKANTTPEAFFTYFLEWAKRDNNLSKNSIIGYSASWRKLTETVTVNRMGDITPDVLKYAFEQWRKNGLKVKGVLAHIRNLSALLNKAIEWDMYSGESPLKGLSKPLTKSAKKIERIPTFMTNEEYPKLLETCKAEGDFCYMYAMMMIHLGLRQGESLNIRWEDVDLEKRTALVRYKDEDEEGEIQEWNPKNKKLRSVPIKQVLLTELLTRRKEKGYIVDRVNKYTGKDINRDRRNALSEFTKAAKASGIMKKSAEGMKAITSHDCRRTFVSLACQAGVPLFKCQEWCGHSSEEITLIYASLGYNYDADIERF